MAGVPVRHAPLLLPILRSTLQPNPRKRATAQQVLHYLRSCTAHTTAVEGELPLGLLSWRSLADSFLPSFCSFALLALACAGDIGLLPDVAQPPLGAMLTQTVKMKLLEAKRKTEGAPPSTSTTFGAQMRSTSSSPFKHPVDRLRIAQEEEARLAARSKEDQDKHRQRKALRNAVQSLAEDSDIKEGDSSTGPPSEADIAKRIKARVEAMEEEEASSGGEESYSDSSDTDSDIESLPSPRLLPPFVGDRSPTGKEKDVRPKPMPKPCSRRSNPCWKSSRQGLNCPGNGGKRVNKPLAAVVKAALLHTATRMAARPWVPLLAILRRHQRLPLSLHLARLLQRSLLCQKVRRRLTWRLHGSSKA